MNILSGKAHSARHNHTTSWYLLAIAIAALLLGLLLYIMLRPPGSALLIPVNLQLSLTSVPLLSSLIGALPTFLHVYAFALLTTVVLGLTPRHAAYASSLWLLINSLFEIGQITYISDWLINNMPYGFQQLPILEQLPNYFAHGTFDWLDLCAAVLGAIAAYVTVQWQLHRGV